MPYDRSVIYIYTGELYGDIDGSVCLEIINTYRNIEYNSMYHQIA